jgi:antitoxin ParD1/3/4
MVEEAESRYVTKMNDLRAAIDAGQKDLEAGRTRTFTGDEFATYLAERAEQAIRKKRDT